MVVIQQWHGIDLSSRAKTRVIRQSSWKLLLTILACGSGMPPTYGYSGALNHDLNEFLLLSARITDGIGFTVTEGNSGVFPSFNIGRTTPAFNKMFFMLVDGI
jgi:hypothetical protein